MILILNQPILMFLVIANLSNSIKIQIQIKFLAPIIYKLKQVEQAFKRADLALFAAKGKGRNQVISG